MEPRKKKWKKILYENQGFPDNYTDESFLVELKRNINKEVVTLPGAILGASVVTQEICTVITFVLIYIYLYNEWSEPTMLFYTTSALTTLGFVVYRKYFGQTIREKLGDDVRTVLIFLVFGYLFSPVLHTLTDTISTDTIYTTSFFMMLIHLIFFDYGIPAAIVSNSLSLSAAVFSSICLASRLASAYHAFVLITIAIEIFVLFPLLRYRIRHSKVMTLFLLVTTVLTLSLVSTVMTIVLISALFLINIICPYLFVKYQDDRQSIYGPWDEAIVKDADNTNELIY